MQVLWYPCGAELKPKFHKVFHLSYCPRTSHSPWWWLEYTVNTFFLFTLLFAPGLQHWNLCSSSKITSLWAVKLQAVDQFGKILWCQECNAKKRRGEDFKIWLEQTRLEKQKQLCIQHREQGKSSLLVQQKLPLSTPPGSVWGSPWKGFPGPLKVLTISDCDYITM